MVGAAGIIDLYFLKADAGRIVTFNVARYQWMISNLLLPKMQETLRRYVFQQDDAACHLTRATMNLIKNKFGEQ